MQEAESEAAARLRGAFERVRNPMLMLDDQRRCVNANDPACELLGVRRQDIPWRRLDDFAPAEYRQRLDEGWRMFLANGAIEGWYRLPTPDGGVVPVEFSATANVLPGRHLSVVMPRSERSPEDDAEHEIFEVGELSIARESESEWIRVSKPDDKQIPLTAREREVLGLVAGGLRGGGIAEKLVLSPETIKSHVQNAMTKLGAHTRAHAVAIALRTGQIDMFMEPETG